MRTEKVYVPVIQKCFKTKDVPALPAAPYAKEATIDRDAIAASIDTKQLYDYAVKTHDLINGCAED